MEDADLQAIRQARLAELQRNAGSGGGGGGGGGGASHARSTCTTV